MVNQGKSRVCVCVRVQPVSQKISRKWFLQQPRRPCIEMHESGRFWWTFSHQIFLKTEARAAEQRQKTETKCSARQMSLDSEMRGMSSDLVFRFLITQPCKPMPTGAKMAKRKLVLLLIYFGKWRKKNWRSNDFTMNTSCVYVFVVLATGGVVFSYKSGNAALNWPLLYGNIFDYLHITPSSRLHHKIKSAGATFSS